MAKRIVKREHPVSRVLSWVTIYLKNTLRCSFRDRTRGSAGSLVPSYSVLLRTGFSWHGNYFPPGGLLPHLFTLTLKRAVYFCGTFLWFAPTGCYPASCPVEPGLSSLQKERPPRILPEAHYIIFSERERNGFSSTKCDTIENETRSGCALSSEGARVQ